MRVISQDGTIDTPYEGVLITLGCSVDKREYHINGHLIHQEGSSSVKIATYSTEEKAKKAMEMLRKAYVGSIVMFQNVEPTDELKEMLKIHGIETIYAILDNQPQEIKFENHQNFYFQFPTEEELE